jgi:hypothetical protein
MRLWANTLSALNSVEAKKAAMIYAASVSSDVSRQCGIRCNEIVDNVRGIGKALSLGFCGLLSVITGAICGEALERLAPTIKWEACFDECVDCMQKWRAYCTELVTKKPQDRTEPWPGGACVTYAWACDANGKPIQR